MTISQPEGLLCLMSVNPEETPFDDNIQIYTPTVSTITTDYVLTTPFVFDNPIFYMDEET